MAENDNSINLLPKKDGGFMGQFLDWALTIGRLLIILTEIVALGTFIYRFSLDMQLVDLHDKIKAESFIVANFQTAEGTFRDLQARLETAKQYIAVQSTTQTILSDIIAMGKGKITFTDITVGTQSVTINLDAPTGSAITVFITALKAYPQITDVQVDKVDNDPTNATIHVSLTATLKPSAFAPPNLTGDSSNGGDTNTQSGTSGQ